MLELRTSSAPRRGKFQLIDEMDRSHKSAAQERPARTIRYIAAVLALPLIVLWQQDNILFTGVGFITPWAYYGFFRNLLEFEKTLSGNPVAARLSWILPGAALYKLLPPLAANYTLHLGVHSLAAVCLFLTLKWVVGARRAFVTTLLFSINPYLCSATGWDDVDGISIAYCLLTICLLTWAALSNHRRWPLLAAGMSFAGVVYCNSDWLVLSFLPLYYVGLMRTWHKSTLVHSFFVLCRWFGAGCAILTIMFCLINKYLDGSFLLYGGPVLQLLHPSNGLNQPSSGLWLNQAPAPWLLCLLAALPASGMVLLQQARSTRYGLTIAALFSLQFLGSLAWMVWGQLRGSALLGLPYHANILLPLSFLVIGARFWPELDAISFRNYRAFCVAAAIVLGYAWIPAGTNWIPNLPYPAWLGLAVITASLVWKQSPDNMVWALAGFFVLTAMGVSFTYGAGMDPHGFREEFQVQNRARDRVEEVRHGQPVRFWYDKQDRAMLDGMALASSYSWSNSLFSQSFAAVPCNRNLAPSTVIAIISADRSHGSEFAAAALNGCWSGKGVRAVPVETDLYHRGSIEFELSLLRLESVSPDEHPVRMN